MEDAIWPDDGAPPAPDKTAAPPGEAAAENTPAPEVEAASDERPLRERVIDAICTVFDPEIPVNIWELGLIYDLDIDEAGQVAIQMTLTSPACPVAESLPADVQSRVREVAGVGDVTMELVWEPPWTMEKLSEAARLQMGLM
jgi:FeS assembly SUF system protein